VNILTLTTAQVLDFVDRRVLKIQRLNYFWGEAGDVSFGHYTVNKLKSKANLNAEYKELNCLASSYRQRCRCL
jgi:hypothetical protein